eukprot:scpid46369/ scgid12271/ 
MRLAKTSRTVAGCVLVGLALVLYIRSVALPDNGTPTSQDADQDGLGRKRQVSGSNQHNAREGRRHPTTGMPAVEVFGDFDLEQSDRSRRLQQKEVVQRSSDKEEPIPAAARNYKETQEASLAVGEERQTPLFDHTDTKGKAGRLLSAKFGTTATKASNHVTKKSAALSSESDHKRKDGKSGSSPSTRFQSRILSNRKHAQLTDTHGDKGIDEDGVIHPFPFVSKRPSLNVESAAGVWANQGRQQHGVSEDIAKHVREFILFVGYPRSCHSLVAAQLDAHPHMVVSHEYDMLSHWEGLEKSEQTRMTVFNTLFNETFQQAYYSLRAAAPGSRYSKTRNGYTYGVPHQWQGNYNKSITIIGDKHGGRTAKLINGVHRAKIDGDVFEQISKALNIKLVFVHVIRHPLDNVATILLRNRRERKIINGTVVEAKEVLDDPRRLAGAIKTYTGMVDAVAKVKARYRTVDVRCEDMVADPVSTLRKLCDDLKIQCPSDYIEDSASIVKPVRSRTRNHVKWTPKLLKNLMNSIAQYDFITKNYEIKL